MTRWRWSQGQAATMAAANSGSSSSAKNCFLGKWSIFKQRACQSKRAFEKLVTWHEQTHGNTCPIQLRGSNLDLQQRHSQPFYKKRWKVENTLKSLNRSVFFLHIFTIKISHFKRLGTCWSLRSQLQLPVGMFQSFDLFLLLSLASKSDQFLHFEKFEHRLFNTTTFCPKLKKQLTEFEPLNWCIQFFFWSKFGFIPGFGPGLKGLEQL